ncbi:Mbov_0121 family peptidase domain-containing ABC transporter [Mycoplasmopsis adleri]|uniref:Mbov_0121 family peptidase domain-containing ABC transporter n=1 Tax=Mycoplasmopsis adleri TaxID=51362 RepID=UPI0038733872
MKIYKQEDQKDCGLYVLQSLIYKYHNRMIDINYLKINSTYSNEGISLLNLKNLASMHGVKLEPYYCDLESLKSIPKDQFPLVLLTQNNSLNHYVILTNIKNDKFVILDSAYGKKRIYTEEELKQTYQGIVLSTASTNMKISDKNFHIENKLKDLITSKEYIYPLLLSAIINLILTFSSTFFIKIIFDLVLPNFLKQTLIVIFVLFLWLSILKFLNDYFKRYIVQKISNKIFLKVTEQYFNKLKNTSINNLNKLNNADYFKRASYIAFISEYKANFFYTFISEILSFIGATLLLIWLNYILFVTIFAISLILIIINVIHQNQIDKKYSNLMLANYEKVQIDLDLVNSKHDLSNPEYADFMLWKLHNKTINLKTQDQIIFNSKNNNMTLNGVLINNISNIVIFISTFLIIKQKLSTGDMMMFLTGITFFINPLLSMSSILTSYTLMKKFSDQLNFVFLLKNRENFSQGTKIEKINKIKLTNLTFGYEDSKNILNIKELLIDQNVQLTGSNGCGKSSLVKLLKGDFDNFNGHYLINNTNFNQINFEDFKNSIFYAGNKTYLPNLKIIDYITNGDNENLQMLNYNLDKYDLFNYLSKINLNLNSEANNDGSNLSSGQKQIIILLKLFCKKYNLVILDEAFENIDERYSAKLKEAIKDFHKDSLFIEISHNSNFIFNNKEVRLDEINQSF